jgi:small-conductance mechanosensitive channel
MGLDPAWGQESGSGGSSESGNSGGSSTQGTFFSQKTINEGLGEPEAHVHRDTPQATLENFLLAAREKHWEQAAHSLNLQYVPTEEQAQQGPELARKLAYVINQKVWIDWKGIPDRRDGQSDPVVSGLQKSSGPQRSILLTQLELDGRSVPLRLQRVKPAEGEPVWLFSAQTVDNIGALYAVHGPSSFEQMLPEWATQRVWGVPVWNFLGLALAIALGLAVGWIVRQALLRVAKRSKTPWVDGLVLSIKNSVTWLITFLVVYLAANFLLNLPGEFNKVFDPVLLALVLITAAWAVMTGIDFLFEYVVRSYVTGTGEEQSDNVRQMLTQLSVAKRVVGLVVFLGAIGIFLMQLNLFRVVGISLLASAGALGVILGIAAQSILGNILAGLQIALTKPVRIGDAVLFEGNWGTVEQITFTYVTIRTWDLRRIVVPLQYLISHPIENWSKTDPHLIKPVLLYLDFTAPIDQIREHFLETLKDNELYDDENGASVQMTAVDDETIELRCLCSGKDSADAWNLHCQMREHMVKYIRDLDDGKYLPRRRLLLQGGTDGDYPKIAEAVAAQQGNGSSKRKRPR